MASPTMDEARFAALIEAYGADPRRWPAAERDAALMLAAEPRMQEMLRKAAQLDETLDRLPAAQPDAALRGAIFASLPARTAQGMGWRESVAELVAGIGGWRLAGPALAMALAGGVAIGVQSETVDAGDAPAEDTELLAFAQLGESAWSEEDGETP